MTVRSIKTHEGEETVVYETLLPSEAFDRDVIVTFRPDVGAAGATAYRDGRRLVLVPDERAFVEPTVDSAGADEPDGGCACNICDTECVNCPNGSSSGMEDCYYRGVAMTSYCGECRLGCTGCDSGW